jgi:hypothetical protein
MKRFIEGQDRTQSTLLPECIDDYVAEDNPVRVIEAFVEELDLGELGFDGVEPEEIGQPAYHPLTLLKLYILCVVKPGFAEAMMRLTSRLPFLHSLGRKRTLGYTSSGSPRDRKHANSVIIAMTTPAVLRHAVTRSQNQLAEWLISISHTIT